MTARPWKEGSKRLLRRVVPGKVFDALLAAYRTGRDLAFDGERRRDLLLVHPISFLGGYPGRLYPKTLAISLTTRCNLRCFICRREGHRGQDLAFPNLARLRKAIGNASVIDLTGWGECLLYPRFEDVVRFIRAENGREDLIQITTNGTLLSAEVARLLSGSLHRLVVSLNAASAETYRREMAPGELGKTLDRLGSFLAALPAADRRKVIVHFVAHAANFREIPDFVRLAREAGVPNVTVGQYLVDIPEHHRYTLLNVREEYDRVVERADALGRELGVALFARRFGERSAPAKDSCRDPFDSCFVEADGRVGPCCFCGPYRIGNAFEEGFEAIWFGPTYRRLRRERYLPACRTCSPYIPLDDPRAHFTAAFKERGEFPAICAIYSREEPPHGGDG